MISNRGRLTLRRGGDFTISLHGSNHCGTEKVLRLDYLVEVECDLSLDDRGFLFDQTKIAAYFHDLKSTALSCEELAMAAARDIHAIVKEENPACRIHDFKLHLRSKGWEAAFVTFHFNDERDTIPCPPLEAAAE